MCGRAEDADTAGGVLDDGKDDQPRAGQGARVEEVGSEEGVRLTAQEAGPGEVIPVGCGRDAVGLEDLPDRGRRDRDSQDGEFTVDSPVAPTGVVARQAQDESADAAQSGWSAGSCRARDPRMAAAQQVAVPAQDRVGRDEQREPSQRWSRELVQQSGEKGPVRQGEPGFIDPALQDGELVA